MMMALFFPKMVGKLLLPAGVYILACRGRVGHVKRMNDFFNHIPEETTHGIVKEP
jgi:hypothetical protein